MIYEKLVNARIKLQSTSLKKSGHNKFAGYQYFELGDFLPAINSIFLDVGICSITTFDKDMASLRLVDIEDFSEALFTSPMAEANLKGCHPIQNLGAVETYQRRYLYMIALEIVEHDAIDSTEPIKKETPNFKYKPTDGAFERIVDKDSDKPSERQMLITALCRNVLKITADGTDLSVEAVESAFNAKESLNMDADELVAFWGLLGKYSKLRRAIKDYGEMFRDKNTEDV